MQAQPQTHRRRPGKRHSKEGTKGTSQAPVRKGPSSGPLPIITDYVPEDDLLQEGSSKNNECKSGLLKSSNKHGGNVHHQRRKPSFRKGRDSVNKSSQKHLDPYGIGCCYSPTSNPNSCYEYTGCDFLIPAMSVWGIILMMFWFPDLKDNALDYYYLHYPELQPVSPIPGTVLPLIPNVWMYDIDPGDGENKNNNNEVEEESSRQRTVRYHLKQHKQPHYYMLPQDYYDQQSPSEGPPATTGDASMSNTAFEAPKIRGVLIVLHNCHQTGLHFFQLPESRIVAAQAMQRGLAIFSPTASSAPKLISKETPKSRSGVGSGGDDSNAGQADNSEKNCWSAELDGDELLGPILFAWARELKLESLPRMAIGVSNGANLLITSSLYKTLRLQSMALYASHHPKGFDPEDLDRDIVPATAFVAFTKSTRATELAWQNHNTLLDRTEQVHKDNGSSQKSLIFQVDAHPWTPSLCQNRLPEYHTRCRSFFRHVQQFQKKKIRKQEEKQMKQDPQQRAKRNRLGGGYAKLKQRAQLISSKGEVLQTSKNPQWIPVMNSLGLDDWTTHTMAFTLASGLGRTTSARRQQRTERQKKTKSQLLQFPTTATPEGRSWLWASMLQEIEVAFGVQEMTSEYSQQVLEFLLHHAGLSKL